MIYSMFYDAKIALSSAKVQHNQKYADDPVLISSQITKFFRILHKNAWMFENFQ